MPEKSRSVIWHLSKVVGYPIRHPLRFFFFTCFSVGFSCFLFSGTTAVTAWVFWKGLPKLETLQFDDYRKLATKAVQSKSGGSVSKIDWVEIDQVSRDYLYSIVMAEDSTFFEHHGVNFEALGNAMIVNLKKRDYEFGASTITQQVVKNLFFDDEKSLFRKAKEIVLSFRIEHSLTKNQILEIYFNLAEAGPNIFGLKSAASHYFNKSPNQINAAEGAFIALMLPSPRRFHYSAYENRNLDPEKRKKLRRILSDMTGMGYLSHEQFVQYLNYDYFGDRKPAHAKAR